MAGEQIGSLFTSLTLESQSFFVDLARVGKRTQQEVAGIQRSLNGITTGFKSMFALIGGGALVSAGKRALDYAGSLGEVSQQLGVTSRDLQVFRYIGSQVGVEQAEMDKGLQRLTRTMGEADAGSKKQATAFRELGVAVRDVNGRVLTAGEVMPRLADAFAQIKDPATRARLETQLFGKAGQQLDPLLTQGSKGVEALTKRADELGIVLGDDLVKKADDASDRLTELTTQLESKFAHVVADNADGILAFADAFATLANMIFQAGGRLKSFMLIAGGAAVGGKFAGARGALVGGLGGNIAAMADRAANDPHGVRDMSDADLRKRENEVAGAWGKLQGNSWTRDGQDARDLQGILVAINREQVRRNQAQSQPMATPPDTEGGSLPRASGGGHRSRRGRTGPTEKELADRRREIELEHQLARAEAQGDQDRVRALREIQAFRRQAADYERAGLKDQQAWLAAAKDMLQIGKDEQATLAANLEIAQEGFELDIARIEGNRGEIAYLERNEYLRQRIAYWQREGLSLTEAQLRAEKEFDRRVVALDESKMRQRAIDEQDRQIALARARGDSPQRIRALEDARWIDRRTKEILDLGASGGGGGEPEVSGADARAQAQREANEMLKAEQTGYWRDTFKNGVRAALDRDFGSWFENWWKDRLSTALSDALDSVADKAGSIFGSKGGDDFLSSIGRIFGFGGGGLGAKEAALTTKIGSLPGFAGGGDFVIKGNPGIDTNIMSINRIPVARVSTGERFGIHNPANDRRGAGGRIELVVYADEGAMFVPRVEALATSRAVTVMRGGMEAQARVRRRALR